MKVFQAKPVIGIVLALFAMLYMTCDSLDMNFSQYTVTFNKNNTDAGSTEADPQTKTVTRPTMNVGTLPTPPTRPGWNFVGWNTQANGSGTAFTETTTVNGDITVYAHWTPVTYTVTFNKNNTDAGSTEANRQTKTVTRPATNVGTLPTAPTRPGWNFVGWNTHANDSGTAFTATTTVNGDITVYAQWTPDNPRTVTFNKNNTDAGSTEAYPQTKTVTTPATTVGTLPTPPERPHYTFNGWNTQANNSGTAFTVTTTVNGDITVYAQWTPDLYTVTFNKNNTNTGSTEANPQTKTVTRPATNVGTLPTPPTRPGWTFVGWNTQANGNGTAFTATTNVNGSITVYAIWSCTVTFNKNNTDTGSTEANPQKKTVTTPATTVDTLPTAPTRPHYTFNGWNTQANGNGTAFTANTTVNGDITVYAQWTPVTYTVTFNKNNTDAGSTEANPQSKTVTRPATNVGTLPTPPERPHHYTFNGWNTQANGSGTAFTATTTVNGDITVFAQWTPVTYTVTFNKNNTAVGSTEANPQTKTVTRPATNVGTLPTPPTRPGWTFVGWNTQANNSGTAFTETTAVNGSITVYAIWSCTVTFAKNNTDTVSTEANPQKKTVTTPATTVGTLPAPPTRPHYTFNGWNTQANGSGTAFTANTTVNGDITVYAQWTPVTYTVTFNKNNTDAGSTEANPQTKTVTRPATNVGTLPTEPTRPHYTFNGWNTQANGNGTAFTATTTVNGYITVYAQWAPVTYTVTFNKNNTDAGSTEANPQTKTVTRPATNVGTLPTAPTRPGWIFVGWNTQANNSGTAFTATTAVNGSITVYAQWHPTIVPGSSLTAKLGWLEENALSNIDYAVEVIASESISPATLSYSGRNNIGITIKSKDTTRRTISLSANNSGSMFRVGNGVTLTLENITLQGRTNNNSLVQVNSGGKLVMNNGSSIINNTRGGVSVDNNGIFTMNGGEISNNSNLSNYAGVLVSSGASFTMNGGKIFGNFINMQAVTTNTIVNGYTQGGTSGTGGSRSASNIGTSHGDPGGNGSAGTGGTGGVGGVSVYGKFVMYGGEIFDNGGGRGTGGTAGKGGAGCTSINRNGSDGGHGGVGGTGGAGGVAVWAMGSFIMYGGEVKNNYGGEGGNGGGGGGGGGGCADVYLLNSATGSGGAGGNGGFPGMGGIGGLFVERAQDFIITGGIIHGNSSGPGGYGGAGGDPGTGGRVGNKTGSPGGLGRYEEKGSTMLGDSGKGNIYIQYP